ncbi:Protein of unknown function [Bacillus toyonensis]|nr:Protein of unknown function [Bacillus toyonensis]
MGRFGL